MKKSLKKYWYLSTLECINFRNEQSFILRPYPMTSDDIRLIEERKNVKPKESERVKITLTSEPSWRLK
jgi:hypothetical protein